MAVVLMILVCAVMVLGWVLAGIAFVASFVSIIPRLRDHPGTSPEDRVPVRSISASDNRFLHDVGIRP
jgi:hypothetical protein